jgi:glutamate-1-semialdehyde 2,1-aminomutase
MDDSSSQRIFEKYAKITPGGVQSNFRFEEPYPLYFKRARGSKMWDVDGNQYTDFLVGYGSIILGHNDPTVRENVNATLEGGLSSGVETELSYRLSQALCDMIPSAEAARVSTTGTEAVMHAIMLARAHSGRNRIVKVEGAYHGWYDPIALSHYPPIDKAGPSERQAAWIYLPPIPHYSFNSMIRQGYLRL